MDSTLTYSIAAGVAIVFLFFLAKFAIRWFIRLAIVAVILAALAAAAWVWLNTSSTPHATNHDQLRPGVPALKSNSNV